MYVSVLFDTALPRRLARLQLQQFQALPKMLKKCHQDLPP